MSHPDPSAALEALGRFSPATAQWFADEVGTPTAAQAGAWEAISGGEDALVVAPTGSGKTLAAFLWAIDRLRFGHLPDAGGRDEIPPDVDADTDADADAGAAPAGARDMGKHDANAPDAAAPETQNTPGRGTSVLYVSPLKALGVDVERNLDRPLGGTLALAERLGLPHRPITVGVRSGDTTSAERRRLVAHPPDILITTPESLFLMLTSKARETLTDVSTVILDEVHAVAGTKRGAHLALSLARLDAMLEAPAQRIGLAATVEPVEEVRAFMSRSDGPKPTLVKPPSTKTWDIAVRMPVGDLEHIPAPPDPDEDDVSGTIWPHVERQILDEILLARSVIVFTNSRRQAERLTSRLNALDRRRMAALDPEAEANDPLGDDTFEPARPDLARAHHGSMSKEHRAQIESELKAGTLRCVVATSSLELGIDMGEVDLVIQVESPFSVSSALQRIGRAGHEVGARSDGVVHPLFAADSLRAAVTVQEALAGNLEPIRMPRNALDVLAQHTVSAAAMEDLEVAEWFDLVRTAAPYADLPESAYESVLDLLTGRYPSTAFAELRPRLVREPGGGPASTDTLVARPGAQRLAVTSGGTIPDRGLYPVHIVASEDDTAPRRVGELDEEMVHETRLGDVITLGTSSWRVEEITHDRVTVSPAFGIVGRVPFWHGESEGRPVRLGRAIGRFARTLADAPPADADERLEALGLDANTREVLTSHVCGQEESTGAIPSEDTLVIERFRDELGDWRVIAHCPLGQRVTAPWALVVADRVGARYGVDARIMAADDGIILRLPMGEEPPSVDLFIVEPGEMEQEVRRLVGSSSLFAARFRECAARALLLPRRDPGMRAPLWQQRQRSAQLLEVAREHPQFPIMLEAARECLQDVYDLPALIGLMESIEQRRTEVREVETPSPSPYARSLLLGYVMEFMYDGDTPAAERRGAVLSLDQSLLAELTADVPLADLLDPDVVASLGAKLREIDGSRLLRGPEQLADALGRLGPIPLDELPQHFESAADAEAAAATLIDAGRAFRCRFAGREHLASALDADVLASALGVEVPGGARTRVPDAVSQLISRWARRRGPFTVDDLVTAFGLPAGIVHDLLDRRTDDGALVTGSITPGRHELEWVDPEVLRRLRRDSLESARREIRPVAPAAYGRFLPRWQGVLVPAQRRAAADAAGSRSRATSAALDDLFKVIDQLSGVSIPASVWESQVLPARIPGFAPGMLDSLLADGEVLWTGHGALGKDDAWIRLHPADSLALGADAVAAAEAEHALSPDSIAARVLDLLRGTPGALRSSEILRALADLGSPVTGPDLNSALMELALGSLITNDSFAPIRSLLSPAAPPARRANGRRPRRGGARLSAAMMNAGVSSADALAVAMGGRWSALRLPEVDPSARSAALSALLLDRHGILTRGSLALDPVPGGFSAISRVLRGLEQAGQCRRGVFIDGLGAAQFAPGGAVDRLRDDARAIDAAVPEAPIVLGACDPANPYGAALDWPGSPSGAADGAARPARRAGALVVLDAGAPAAFIDRAGRHLLAWASGDRVPEVMTALADAVARDRMISQLAVESINGHGIGADEASAVVDALTSAGAYRAPKALRLRGR